jgi:hypothetical protein
MERPCRKNRRRRTGGNAYLKPCDTRRFATLGLSRHRNGSLVAAKAYLHEQAFLAHASEIAAVDADVGQLLRTNLASLEGQRDGPFSERGFAAAGLTMTAKARGLQPTMEALAWWQEYGKDLPAKPVTRGRKPKSVNATRNSTRRRHTI